MKTQYLYELGSNTMDPCSMAPDAYTLARNTWLCPGCARPKPGVMSVDVALQQAPKDIAMNFVYGVGVGIIRSDFLNILGDVEKQLLIGRVFDAQERELQGFRTFRGQTRLVIRGDARSSYRRCDICGTHVYSPMGKFYVLAKCLNENCMVYESQMQGLIVDRDVIDKIKAKKWKELGIKKIEILEIPRDGRPLFCSCEEES